MSKPEYQSSIDPAEVAKFQAMARDWWDPNGKFKPLHMLNPTRLDYVVTQIATEFALDLKAPRPFEGLRILDIGCGGGLMSEPLARLGAQVTGADAAEDIIGALTFEDEGVDAGVVQQLAEEQSGRTGADNGDLGFQRFHYFYGPQFPPERIG